MKLSLEILAASSKKKFGWAYRKAAKLRSGGRSRSRSSDGGGSTSSSSDGGGSTSSSLRSTTSRTVLDGSVALRELEAVLRRIGGAGEAEIEEEELRRAAEEIFAGGGGEEEEMREAFAVFDADGDGRISAEELLAVLLGIGDEGCTLADCRRMIGGVDSDGDGFVCFRDFLRMMDGQPGIMTTMMTAGQC